MKRTSLFLALSGAVALTAGCGAGQEPAAQATSSASSALHGREDGKKEEKEDHKKQPHLNCREVEFEGVSEEVEDQLEIARRSVCKYRRIEAALAAGYEDSGLPCIPGQGYHFIKSKLVGTTDIREPSVLMYTASGDLNSPEWIAFQSDTPVPPSIFGQVMHADEDLPLWELHVWVWKLNPNGVFNDINPNVTCP